MIASASATYYGAVVLFEGKQFNGVSVLNQARDPTLCTFGRTGPGADERIPGAKSLYHLGNS